MLSPSPHVLPGLPAVSFLQTDFRVSARHRLPFQEGPQLREKVVDKESF